MRKCDLHLGSPPSQHNQHQQRIRRRLCIAIVDERAICIVKRHKTIRATFRLRTLFCQQRLDHRLVDRGVNHAGDVEGEGQFVGSIVTVVGLVGEADAVEGCERGLV